MGFEQLFVALAKSTRVLALSLALAAFACVGWYMQPWGPPKPEAGTLGFFFVGVAMLVYFSASTGVYYCQRRDRARPLELRPFNRLSVLQQFRLKLAYDSGERSVFVKHKATNQSWLIRLVEIEYICPASSDDTHVIYNVTFRGWDAIEAALGQS